MDIDKVASNISQVELKNGLRWGLYIILLCVGIFSSCDGGIIPQATEKMTEDFDLKNDNKKMGLYGSIDYLGRVFGALFFTFTINKIRRKILLASTLIFKSLLLFYPLIDHNNYKINLILRCLSGISQVFYTTYLPVWTDQFTPKDSRAILVSLTQLGNPLGIIIGFGISTLVTSTNWNYSFAIEGIILLLLACFSLFFPNLYYSKKFILNDDGLTGKLINNDDDKKSSSLCNNLGKILCNVIFIFTTFSCSVAFFGMAVVQYWGAEYMKNVLNLEDPSSVLFTFSILCLTGPTLGVFAGGIICSKLGGYTNKKSIVMCFIFCLISSIFSLFIGYVDKLFFFVHCWIYFFFIGAIIPATSGIIIVSLPEYLRGDGFSITNILLNLLGNFPASFAYSFLLDYFTVDPNNIKEAHRSSMKNIMYYNFVGLFCILISMIFRLVQKDKENNEERRSINITETDCS